jgi:hypothetical protein
LYGPVMHQHAPGNLILFQQVLRIVHETH